MKILVIDNYDSFTYNLVYLLRKDHSDVDVYRNDKITPDQCLNYDAIMLSPGPGIPKDAGNLCSIIEHCSGKVPLFGVCLGHQAIAEHLGGKLRMLNKVFHGVQSQISLVKNTYEIFNNIPSTFRGGRYHSWDVILTGNENFEVLATTDNGSIMAIQNFEQKLFGIQFHPESILTPEGPIIIQNFLRICNILKNEKDIRKTI